MRGHYRHTKIIATVGPATESPEKLAELIRSGVDVIRLNMAHGTGEWITAVIKRVRAASRQVNRDVAVMLDVKGPEIRTGPVAETIDLKTGDTFEFYTESPTQGTTGVIVNYAGFPADVKVGATVLLDSGLIRLEVLRKI